MGAAGIFCIFLDPLLILTESGQFSFSPHTYNGGATISQIQLIIRECNKHKQRVSQNHEPGIVMISRI